MVQPALALGLRSRRRALRPVCPRFLVSSYDIVDVTELVYQCQGSPQQAVTGSRAKTTRIRRTDFSRRIFPRTDF